MTLGQALAAKLRQVNKERGWTQVELARRLGYSRAAINYLLKNRRRKGALEFYEKVAQLCGLTITELFAELEARVKREPPPPHETRLTPFYSFHVGPGSGKTAVLRRYLRELRQALAAHQYTIDQLTTEHRRAEQLLREAVTTNSADSGSDQAVDDADNPQLPFVSEPAP